MWCGSSGSVVHRQMLSRGGIPIRATIYINNMYEYCGQTAFCATRLKVIWLTMTASMFIRFYVSFPSI